MAQRSHVPKFGNWDGENVPYTAYFENARKEKAGALRMNPNDPEENPEAFMFGGYGGSDDLSLSFPANYVQTGPDKSSAVEKNHSEVLKKHLGHQRNASYQRKSISQKSMTPSESGSEKSYYEYSRRSDRRKSSESSNGFAKQRGRRNPSEDLSSRSASVPRFGAWDERDPKSGEGFTVIFNKVKEEKQIAAANFPPVQPQINSNKEGAQRNKPRSKVFCCLF